MCLCVNLVSQFIILWSTGYGENEYNSGSCSWTFWVNSIDCSTTRQSIMLLFSPQLFRDRVMELNSSDERGINVIREKVKKFAQFSVIATRNEWDFIQWKIYRILLESSGVYCPPFKLIILDECDSMTKAAQVIFIMMRILFTWSSLYF